MAGKLWERTYERHCAALTHIEGNLFARPKGVAAGGVDLASLAHNQRASKRRAP
jgi:hypothetical protein